MLHRYLLQMVLTVACLLGLQNVSAAERHDKGVVTQKHYRKGLSDSHVEKCPSCLKKIKKCLCQLKNQVDENFQAILERECTVIKAIPAGGYVISKPGCYVFGNELNFSEVGGAAISIQAPDVTLDGGGFTLSVGPSTLGIYAAGVSNLRFKNMQVQATELSGDSNCIGFYFDTCNHLKFEDVYTALTFRGIVLIDSPNSYFIRIIQENHNFGISPDDVHSSALRIYGGSTYSFDECKWVNNTHVGDNPWDFNDTDAIAFVGSFDPSPDPVMFSVNMQNCQMINSNIIGYDVSNIIMDKCNSTLTIPFPYPLVELIESYDHISIRNSTFRSSNSSYIQGLISFFDTRGALVENCIVESTASGVGDPESPWPTGAGACLINIGGQRYGDSVTIRGCQLIGGPAGNRTPEDITSLTSKSSSPIAHPHTFSHFMRENRKQALQDLPTTPFPDVLKNTLFQPQATVAPRALIGIYVSQTTESAGQGVTIEGNTLAHFNSGETFIPPADPNDVAWYSTNPGAAIFIAGCSGVVVRNNTITDVANGGPDRGPGNGIVLQGAERSYFWTDGISIQTTTNFNQPTVGNTVSVSVTDTTFLSFLTGANPFVYIFNGGYYDLVSIDTPTSITVRNLGFVENVAAGTTILSGSQVAAAVLTPESVCCTVIGNIVTNCEGTGIVDDNPLGNNRVLNNISYFNGVNYAIPDAGTIVSTTSPALAGQNVE